MQRFWTTAQLLARGRSEREIRRAVASGALRSVRKGWFTVPDTHPDLVRAVRVGGVLTGPSAAGALGLWTPPDRPAGSPRPESSLDRRVPDRLHVAVARRSHRLRDPDDALRPLEPRSDVVLHRVEPQRIERARRLGIAPAMTVLEHAFRVLPPERALAVLDSALHNRYLLPVDLPALRAALPPRSGPVVEAADGRAESGLESITRYNLRAAGLRVDVLVGVRGVGTVDLVVEDRLIVELDGKGFHASDEAFARDRRRDLVATTARYRPLRFTWYQVLFRWNEVEAAVFAALAVR